MVSAVLSGTGRKDGDEEGVAHGEGIGGEIAHESEFEAAGLSHGENLHELVCFLPHGCAWIHKVTSGYI